MVEKRKEHRMFVGKQGIIIGKNDLVCIIEIKDISKNSLGFSTKSYNTFKKGDFLKIQLGNINVWVQVVRKDNDHFGCIII